MPMDKDMICDLLHSLEGNHTLEKLELFAVDYDYLVRFKRSLDPMMAEFGSQQLLPVNPSQVKGDTKLGNVLRKNTSLKYLTLFFQLQNDELHDIEDNRTLERLLLPLEFQSECLFRDRISWVLTVCTSISLKIHDHNAYVQPL